MESKLDYLTTVLNARCEKRHLEAGNIRIGYRGRKIPWTTTHVKNNRRFCYADSITGESHLCNTCHYILENKELVYIEKYHSLMITAVNSMININFNKNI